MLRLHPTYAFYLWQLAIILPCQTIATRWNGETFKLLIFPSLFWLCYLLPQILHYVSHGYKQRKGDKDIKAVTKTCQYLLQVWHLQFFKMLLEKKELTFEYHYILESSSFLRDWFNPTVLIHRVQTLSWTKNPGIFHGGIESLFWNSRTSNKVCSNSCFREFTTTVTSHIIRECPSSLPPNTHALPWESIALWPNHATLKNLQKDCFSEFKLYKLAKTRVRLDQIYLSRLFAEFFSHISTKSF